MRRHNVCFVRCTRSLLRAGGAKLEQFQFLAGVPAVVSHAQLWGRHDALPGGLQLVALRHR